MARPIGFSKWPFGLGKLTRRAVHGILGETSLIFPHHMGNVGALVSTTQATQSIILQAESCIFSSKRLDPGSDRIIPATWHGAGAHPGDFISET